MRQKRGDTNAEGDQVAAEAETGEARPQPGEAWAPGAERGRKDPPVEALEGGAPGTLWSQTSGPRTGRG